MREFRRSQFGDIISAPFSRRRLGGALIKITFHFQPESPVPSVWSPARCPCTTCLAWGFRCILRFIHAVKILFLGVFFEFIARIRCSYVIMKKMIAL